MAADPFRPGPRNLITDVPGILVGNAEDHGAKTGVTVLTGADRFVAGVSVMGGAPGTRETDALAPDKLVEKVDALVLAGGSAFGLDAAGAVMEALAQAGRGHPVGPMVVPIVPAAILFDLLNGGDKDWTTPPYRRLGEAALAAAGPDFALGGAGAGVGATTADFKGGLGSASLTLPGGATVGALVAVNALGSVAAPGGRRFWAGAWEIDDEFGGHGPPEAAVDLGATFIAKNGGAAARQNTTIAIVATDAALSSAEASRLATAAQDGMARAIAPAHTPFDGDLVFSAATGRGEAPAGPGALYQLGHAAAVCLTRAIARGVYAATPAAGDGLPCWRDRSRAE